MNMNEYMNDIIFMIIIFAYAIYVRRNTDFISDDSDCNQGRKDS